MPEPLLPTRDEIPIEYTWNAISVFASEEEWQAESGRIASQLPDLAGRRGHLADGPPALADALEAIGEIVQRVGKVLVYAAMAHNVDTTDQAAAKNYSQAMGLYGQLNATIAYLNPELIAIGEETLGRWIENEPRLAIYEHYIDDLFRKQAHVREAPVEELLGMLVDPFSGTRGTARMLTDADFRFESAVSSQGDTLPLTQGTLLKILNNPDREARRTAFEHYTDLYLAFKNTLANNLLTSVKQNVFTARARRHRNTLEASLFQDNIPTEVFQNLIETFRANLPTWHQYWAIRKAALGFDQLEYYDIWAPLTDASPQVTYEQVVDWICEGLAPLGKEYVEVMRRGCLDERWVDVYPNQGKRAGAFSSGAQGTHPFILMNFAGNLLSLSTLAHELGHSMHSHLTWKNQPWIYSDYPLFVAEVASNFHQAMVREHLLATKTDPAFQISLIEEAMSNFHRYFLVMPTLARFELEVHERVERGEGLSADDMIELAADLFTEAYGDEMHVERERFGILWAAYGHLYVDYYVFQYATGISGAHALARRISSGEPGAVDDYLSFLQAGGSLYPLEALKLAGVDLTRPEPIQEAFQVMSDYVGKLQRLLGA